jgi:hypothetical protein
VTGGLIQQYSSVAVWVGYIGALGSAIETGVVMVV